MATNPVNIHIGPNSQGFMNCVSNAAYFQRVNVSVFGTVVSFQGTGEGQAMTTGDGGTSYELPTRPEAYDITASFEFSTDGPQGHFQSSSVKDPIVTSQGGFTMTEITAEDSVDNDNNDSYLTVVVVSYVDHPASKVAVAAEGTSSGAVEQRRREHVESTSSLELHAKTYYDNPLVSGGDEHYVTIPSFSGSTGVVRYAGTSWSFVSGSCFDQQTPFGGYLNIFVRLNNCTHPGMHDATMMLSTSIGYWGSKPYGSKSATWDGNMYGTVYHLTEVTN